jgi:HK97 gp10 family phage protein
MSGVTMALTGDKELTAAMLKLGASAELVVHDAAERWGDNVTQGAQDRAPVLTGKLREKISKQVDGGDVEVTADTKYATYVELGTGHGPAQPYLYPAFAEHRDPTPEVREALAEYVDL